MSIAYVNGKTFSSTTSANSYTIPYTSIGGNTLVVSAAVYPGVGVADISSIVDSNSVTWTFVTGSYGLWYTQNASAISSITINTSNGPAFGAIAALAEYSSVNSISPTTYHGATPNPGGNPGAHGGPTETVSAGYLMITGFFAAGVQNSAFSSYSGTLRQNVGPVTWAPSYYSDAAIVDEPGSGATSVALQGGAQDNIVEGNLNEWGVLVFAADAIASPSGVSASFAVNSPTISAGATVSPSGVTFASAVHSPTISAGVVVSPSGVTFASAVGTPTADVTANVTVSPAGVSASFAVGTPTISAGATVSPSGVTFASAVGTPVAFTTIILPPSGMQWGRGF